MIRGRRRLHPHARRHDGKMTIIPRIFHFGECKQQEAVHHPNRTRSKTMIDFLRTKEMGYVRFVLSRGSSKVHVSSQQCQSQGDTAEKIVGSNMPPGIRPGGSVSSKVTRIACPIQRCWFSFPVFISRLLQYALSLLAQPHILCRICPGFVAWIF